MADPDTNVTSLLQGALSEPEVEQVSSILCEIGNHAHILCSLLLDYGDEVESNSYHALLSVAEKVGYMADLGVSLTGGIEARGDAEAWFMSPRYRDAKKRGIAARERIPR